MQMNTNFVTSTPHTKGKAKNRKSTGAKRTKNSLPNKNNLNGLFSIL